MRDSGSDDLDSRVAAYRGHDRVLCIFQWAPEVGIMLMLGAHFEWPFEAMKIRPMKGADWETSGFRYGSE